MLNPFGVILIMCALAGLLMIVGAMVLLYLGAIQLSEKNTGNALEAEFRNQLKVKVQSPALGFLVLGLASFVFALYFAKPESGPLVITGHIKIADIGGILSVKLKSDEWPITFSSDGAISTTIQPVEKLSVVIEAPGYSPYPWRHQINPDELKNGRIEIHPELWLAAGKVLIKPRLDNPSQSTTLVGPEASDHMK